MGNGTEVDEAQKEIQRIYEDHILPETGFQYGKEKVTVTLNQEDFQKVCSFFDLFAYS
jgi:hypothetical protein